jgi:hypothetical protein
MECSYDGKYVTVTLIDKNNLVQLVANLEKGKFH